MLIRGSVNSVTMHAAFGWLYASDHAAPLVVRAVLHHEIIGEAVANLPRPDLAAAGMGDGHCGFEISFYRELDPLYLPFVIVSPEGWDLEVPCRTIGGFRDFFRALYEKHPRVGRSRTVFGGLWVDRTDAAAILYGRTAIGLIAGQESVQLANFLRDGFLLLQAATENAPVRKTSNDRRSTGSAGSSEYTGAALHDLVAESLASEPLLRIIRLLLEDQPLIVHAEAIGATTPLTQPSVLASCHSPAECVELVVPIDREPISLDVVRDSHNLPEFGQGGLSRWFSTAAEIEALACESGLLDRYEIDPTAIAVLGPGTIHKITGGPGARALRILCIPQRQTPAALISDGARKESIHPSGARIWL